MSAVDANYSIRYVAGTVSVTPAPLTITASSGTITHSGRCPPSTRCRGAKVNLQGLVGLLPSYALTATVSPAKIDASVQKLVARICVQN